MVINKESHLLDLECYQCFSSYNHDHVHKSKFKDERLQRHQVMQFCYVTRLFDRFYVVYSTDRQISRFD